MVSTNGMIGSGIFSHHGTPGVLKMSFQYSLPEEKVVTKKVMSARIPVTAILPVRFAPPGKIGMMPSMLFRKMKKNSVSR